MSQSEEIISSLLQSNTKSSLDTLKKSNLIQEVGKSCDIDSNDEEPTIFEQMMAAQAKAKKEMEIQTQTELQQSTKAFANGFKKGFFNQSTSKPSKSKNINEQSNNTKSEKSIDKNDIKSNNIPTVKPIVDQSKGKSSLVLNEVQQAMKDDDNPMLQQLRQGDWMTNDLQSKITKNEILLKGLSNPKCVQAMSMMKENPNEAKKRFSGDPDVDVFMKEFGKLMSEHFYSLADGQSKQNKPNNQQVNENIQQSSAIQELGPLQIAAMNKQREMKTSTNSIHESQVDDSRVKEVLEDPELRAMLLDPKLQEILAECNDPRKFQQYMQDPIISKKIMKLYQSGLVGTTK